MEIEIKNQFTGETIISGEHKSVKAACEKNKAILGGAYLRGTDLRGTDLGGADLRGTDLGGADLCGTDLHGANLRGANLRGVAHYTNSHDIFIEICKRERKVFEEKEWSMIGVIAVCRICWDEIREKYGDNINSVFEKLSQVGFDEWEKHYKKGGE